jgi:PAS domain S-box-containing protein
MSFLNSAQDSFYLLDSNLDFIEINNRGLDIIGKSREEVIGKNIDEIVPDVNVSGRRQKHLEVLRTGKPFIIEHFIPHPMFGNLHILLKSFKVGNGLGVIAHEITERVNAEGSLRESEARYRTLFEHSRDALMTLSPPQWNFTSCNNAALELFGINNFSEVTPWDLSPDRQPDGKSSREKTAEMIAIALRKGKHFFEWTHRRADGAIFTATVLLSKVIISAGEILLATVRDVSEQKLANERIIIQRDLGLALGNTSSLLAGLRLCLEGSLRASGMDCGGIYLFTEATGALDLAYHSGLPQAFIEKASHFEPESPNVKIVMQGTPVFSEHLLLGIPIDDVKRGEKLHAIAVIPILSENKAIGCLNVASHHLDTVPLASRASLEAISSQIGNAIVRLKAEERLAAEKERLAVTLRSIGDGVITTDVSGNVVALNKMAEILTGWKTEEAAGRPLENVFKIIDEFTRAPCQNPVRKVVETGSVAGLDSHTLLISRDGREFVLADSGAPIRDNKSRIIGVVLVFRDITEERRLDESLQRAQKLESLGILAGGIAHDFNNLLGGIFGYINLAQEETDPKNLSIYLAKAMGTIDRARGLTQQLLTFAKGGAPIKRIGDLFPLVRDCTQFALSGSRVSYRFNIPENLWLCDFDKNQISQVIDNIVINAQQAMPDGGTIEVFAENIEHIGNLPVPDSGTKFVRISIKDHGVGMPKEMLPRIFDPFYTTKAKGYGLGLATSYSIVNRHGGCIDVESEPGRGSTFHVYLPASPGASEQETVQPAPSHPGKGTIIVMDDEEVIRETTRKMLESLGYHAICALSGTDAVERYVTERGANRKVLGMIFDLTVPGGIGGKDALAAVRMIDRNVPVFVASGYAQDPIMADPGKYGFAASISKPFVKAELGKMLHQHLRG